MDSKDQWPKKPTPLSNERFPDLSELFSDILKRDTGNAAEFLLSIQWILYAKRPLEPLEFYSAVIVGTRDQVQWEWNPSRITAHDLNSFVYTSSKGLARVIRSIPPTVQFIDRSVHDFLLKDGGIQRLWPSLAADFQSQSHDRLKKCCYTYFRRHNHIANDQEPLDASFHETEALRQRALAKFPFLEYATQHVLYHANIAAIGIPQHDFLRSFDLKTWIGLNNLFTEFEPLRHTPSVSLLYILADNNFAGLISSISWHDTGVHNNEELYGYPIFAALARSHREAVRALLESQLGLIVDSDSIATTLPCGERLRVSKVQTPLSWAAEHGYSKLAQLLVEKGPEKGGDLESRDSYGWTPLWSAVLNGHQQIVQMLAQKGANLEAKNIDSQTPLLWAARKGHFEIAQLLIENGADLEAKDDCSWTPLRLAIINGHGDIVQLLAQKGANLESEDICGSTPLSQAARKGHLGIVQVLVDNGANLKSKDSCGLTPLSWAKCGGYQEIVKLLVENGADLESKESHSCTKLLWAPGTSSVENAQSMTKRESTKIRKYVDRINNLDQSQHSKRPQGHDTMIVEPYDDSSYVAPGQGSSNTVQITAGKSNTFTDDPSRSTNALLDDTATTYFSTHGLLAPNGDLLDGLTRILLRDADLKSLSGRARERVLSVLPQLLKSFAERLANGTSSRMHRNAATLIHKYCLKISRHSMQHLSDTNQNFSDDESSSEDEEAQSTDAFKDDTAITKPELIRKWQGSAVKPIDHKFLDPNTHDDEDELMKDVDRFVSQGFEDNTTQTLKRYREIVLASPAYSWLLLNLKKEVNLIQTEPNVMDAIKNSILSFLPLPRRFSVVGAVPNFGVRFDVDWDPLSFFSRQFERQAGDMLGSTLTLTGSFENAQAITCMKYMQQTWPSSGEHTVRLLNEAILKPGIWNECKLLDDTALFAQILEAKLIVIVSGTRYAIAEIGEQLAWIPAALRLAPDSQGVYKCTPSIQYIRIEEHEHEAGLPGALRSLDASFSLLFEISDLPTERHSAGQCWHDLFKNPTIVQGYPIPRRARENTGLDIPLEIMADLVQAPQISTFEERLFLKGFSSMLVLMDQVEGSIIWHLDLNRSGSYISYIDASRPPTTQGMGVENIMDNIMKSRHIVGWCSNAKFYAGTDKAFYPVKKPILKDLNDKCILHEIKPPRIKYIEIPRGYHRADKDKPPYMPCGQDLHRRRLERLKDKYVNLWDVESERGWLVNGVSAWLHLLRARLKHVSEDDNHGPEVREPSILNRYTVHSSLEFFKNAENMNLAVYPSRYQEEERPFTIMDQTDRLYNTLDNLLELQATGVELKPRKSRKYLSGWAFRDLAMEKEQLDPSATILPEIGRSWVDFTRAISAVTLFGRGFGELIRPDTACEAWAELPRGKFLLATSGKVLKRIMDDVGNSPGEPWMLGRDIVWHNPTNPCKCTGKSDSNHADNVQILLPTEISREISQEIRSEEPADNSAFIFGFNPESSWQWQEFGNPTKVPSSSSLDQFQHQVLVSDSAIGSEFEKSQSPPTPAKVYTVGILCTLPEEGAAMKTLFDRVHGELDNYVLGSISNHNIVLAYLPLESGIAAASAAASRLVADFPSVKFGLLVGIAGGVPSRTTDIRLGDVVVGVPKDAHPGVIQLGRGKDLEQNGFQRTGSLNRPPGFLLSAVAALTAEPQECRNQLNNHIRGVVESNPKYQYPGQHFDVLTSAPCDQCRSKCSDRDNHILERQPRDSEYPIVHLGLIGSGDTVIKDSKKRDELAKQFGILCLEMEAAGVMHSDIPFLVIRGISDYADSQKNDQWHNYASLAAAAFATMLLCQYTGTDITIKPTQTGLKRSLSQKNLTPRTRRRLDENSSYSS